MKEDLVLRFSIKLFSLIKGPFSDLRSFLATGRPLKIMKKIYFKLKTVFVFKTFNLITKLRFISKFMTSHRR